MAKGKNSYDDFIVQLGWDDGKALKGLAAFVNKVKKRKIIISPQYSLTGVRKLAQTEDKIRDQKLKKEKQLAAEREKAHTSALKEQARRDKQAISEKKRLEAQAIREKARLEREAISKRKAHEKQAYQERLIRERRLANNRKKANLIRAFTESDNFTTIASKNKGQASNFLREYRKGLNITDSGERASQLKVLSQRLRQAANETRRLDRESKKLNATQRGLRDSTNHLIRSYASIFAIMAGTTFINRTGQSFESLNSAMLAAMGTQAEATKQIQFLEQMTSRLGLSLLDTADQYTKFTFASKGKLPTEEVNMLFEGMAELGTVLGISKERMKLSFTAIQQMMNKGTISSEELKRQFAESMPGGIQLFANALNLSTKELLAQVESGKLLAEDVLPKVAKEMKKVANNGGALELKLKSMRVQQGVFFNEFQQGLNTIFTSGFDEGGGEMFSEMTEQLKLSGKGLEGLGRIFRMVFKVIGNIAKVITPILDSLFFVLGKISDTLVYTFNTQSGQIIAGIGGIGLATLVLTKRVVLLNKALTATLAHIMRIAFIGVTAVAVVDEIASLFDDTRTAQIERSMGRQTGFGSGKAREILEMGPTNLGIAAGERVKAFFGAEQKATTPVIENKVYIDGVQQKLNKEMQTAISGAHVEVN